MRKLLFFVVATCLAVAVAACDKYNGNGVATCHQSNPGYAGGPVICAGSPAQEEYAHVADNPAHTAADEPLSTFSIDVDTASYTNVRRYLNDGQLPPADAVRVEEFINYFDYDYPQATAGETFSVQTELHACPWQPGNKLALIAIKGKRLAAEEVPPMNLVFLVDVSGSMASNDKLPLVKQTLNLMLEQLSERDRIALVVYAGKSGLALDSMSCRHKGRIQDAINRLAAGGSTAGGTGIQLAYQIAQNNFLPGGVNRVILCTDGDFNVGITDAAALEQLITAKRATGVYFTVLGYGMGNLKDNRLEMLADSGNGNYAYIDSEDEARKIFVDQCGSTLIPIANDVKIQVEFNPARVRSYRLIGYETVCCKTAILRMTRKMPEKSARAIRWRRFMKSNRLAAMTRRRGLRSVIRACVNRRIRLRSGCL